jgi:FKBP-type peptidyl-prolyl cis-trans isomerase
MARLASAAVVVAVLAVTGCGGTGGAKDTGPSEASTQVAPAAPLKPTGALAKKPKVATDSGTPKKLVTDDLIVGKGPAAKSGDQLSVQYVGVLNKNGKEFDSSWKTGQPFEFQVGQGMVIPGWDEGIPGMKVGGRRRLVIPAKLAYGAQGSPPTIGPNEPLVFVVDLIGIH